MRGVLHPGQAGLDEGEARLHEHDEHRRNDDPDGVHRDEEIGALHLELHPLQARTCSVVHHGLERGGPDETVARRVSAPGGVGDRLDHCVRATVLDDEDEERLGEEARLEDPAAVLVRDAPLAAVADRLEDGHTDVTGLRLDRVDDRLDALPDDHRLDLDHSPSSLSPQKKPRGLMPPRRPRLHTRSSSTARTRP